MTNFATNHEQMTVGEKIKQVRNEKGLQQKVVALEIGLAKAITTKLRTEGVNPL